MRQANLMLHVMLAFAEFERDMIVERTQSGKSRSAGKRKAGGWETEEIQDGAD